MDEAHGPARLPVDPPPIRAGAGGACRQSRSLIMVSGDGPIVGTGPGPGRFQGQNIFSGLRDCGGAVWCVDGKPENIRSTGAAGGIRFGLGTDRELKM